MRARTARLSARTRADARRVVLVLVRHHATRLWSFEPTARAGVDPEGVHQMRVQARRLRTILRMFRDVLPRRVADDLRRRLAALGAKLGAERDADVLSVLLLGLAERIDDAAAKRALLRRHGRCQGVKVRAHAELAAYLDSAAVVELRSRLGAVLAPPVRGSPVNAEAFAAGAIHELVRRGRRRARKVHAHEAEALHALRRSLKNLRYGVEALRALLPRSSRALARRATWLQDRLGAVHDIDVALGLLGGSPRVRAQLEGEREALLRGVDRRLRRLLGRDRKSAK